MSSPVSGRRCISPESSPQDDSTVQKSRPKMNVCPSKSMVKGSSFPAKVASPAISSLISKFDTPLESSSRFVPAVQISTSSELVCPSNSSVAFPPALFTTPQFTVSSIAAASDHLGSCPAPIWNPCLQSRPMNLAPFPSVFASDRNFRSTVSAPQTLSAPLSFCNSDGVPSPIVNYSLQYAPCIMGNPPVSSISSLRPSIGQLNSPDLKLFPASVHGFSASIPAGSEGLVAGSAIPSSSPVFRGGPTGNSVVDSAALPSQLCRVDSAASSLCSTASAVPVVVSDFPVPPKVSFRNLFAPMSPRSSRLSFVDFGDLSDDIIAPTVVDGIPGILFPDQVISSLAVPFKFALIGRITGNRGVSTNQVLLKEFERFLFLGSFSVKFLPRGFMVINFSLEDDYLHFWSQECFTIGKVSIRFSKWTPEFKFEDESSITPVWVRLPDLPLHLYDKKSLFMIARILGKPVKIDEITADASRGSFARICVEIDVLKPRQDKIWVGWGSHIQTLKVVYENVPFFCVDCMMLGHSAQRCSRNGFRSKASRPISQDSPVTDPPLQVPPPSATSGQVPPSSSAPLPSDQGWIQKRGRRRSVKSPETHQSIPLSNQFEILQSFSDVCPGETSGGLMEDDNVTPVVDLVQSKGHSVVSVKGDASSVVEMGSTLMVVDSSVQDSVGVPPVVVAGVDLPGGPPLCFPPFNAESAPDKRVRLMDSSAHVVSESLPLSARLLAQKRRSFKKQLNKSRVPYDRPP